MCSMVYVAGSGGRGRGMATTTREWSSEVRSLLADLAGITGQLHHRLQPADVTPLGRELIAQESLLRSTLARRDRFLEERRLLEEEIHGRTRALELLDAADDQMGAGARLRRRIDDQRRRLADIDAEIDLVQRRVERLDVEIEALRRRVVAALHEAVENARTERAAALARNARIRMGVVDDDIMWSPVPLAGYRVWIIGDDGLYGARRRWEAPTLVASCAHGDDVPHTDGRCAEVAFGCGIYAAKSATRLMKELGAGLGGRFAAGRVDLEGTVVEHERGYRAQRATVRALAVVDRGTVRFVADEAAIRRVFADPAEAPLVAVPVRPGPESTRALYRLIEDRLAEPAGRYEQLIAGSDP